MMAKAPFEIGTHIRAVQIVLSCADFSAELNFFTQSLNFKINLIMPADSPSIAVISGYGVTLRLEQCAIGDHTPLHLRLLCERGALPSNMPHKMTTPNGTVLHLVETDPPLSVPEGKQEFVLSRNDEEAWGQGRAGMLYRDLIPSRLGGRFIASHIRIPVGGPVPDYVHFHKVRFQMIFCKAGWTKLVYEDQGEPFLLQPGDCVLQPPGIRHRVLEASNGLEVIEIGCPALHETFADHHLELPTSRLMPHRGYEGQRFTRHVAAQAHWLPGAVPGLEIRDLGIGQATDGLAGARVLRSVQDVNAKVSPHGGEFYFCFVLKGQLTFNGLSFGEHVLSVADSVVIPGDAPYTLSTSVGGEFLEVRLPDLM